MQVTKCNSFTRVESDNHTVEIDKYGSVYIVDDRYNIVQIPLDKLKTMLDMADKVTK